PVEVAVARVAGPVEVLRRDRPQPRSEVTVRDEDDRLAELHEVARPRAAGAGEELGTEPRASRRAVAEPELAAVPAVVRREEEAAGERCDTRAQLGEAGDERSQRRRQGIEDLERAPRPALDREQRSRARSTRGMDRDEVRAAGDG